MRPRGAYARQSVVGLRLLVLLTVVLGVGYPLAVTGIAQLPGLRSRADGSLVGHGGRVVGSALIGQRFTDAGGRPLPQYFQSRPSAAGDDPTATGASNLGPESIVDTLPDPRRPGDAGSRSLLTRICARSAAAGRRYGVDGSRPFCADGVGAVLAVSYARAGYRGRVVRVVSVNQECPARPFVASYRGVAVRCARFGTDDATARIVAIRGDAPAHPAVPADAVTASGSGVDPDISPAFARLQEPLVARTRGIPVGRVAALVHRYSTGRELGFLGEPVVNVLQVNLALDRTYPYGR